MVILGTSLLGVTCEAGAIGQAIYYAQALEQKKIITVFGYAFDPRSSFELFLICISGVFIFLLISSWLIYFSQKKIIEIGRCYEEFCSKRVFKLLSSSLGLYSQNLSFTYDVKTILRIAGSDSRYCGRILRSLISSITPAITFIFSITYLFYINFILSFLVLSLAGASIFFLYKINIKGAFFSRLMEEYSRSASYEKRKIIERYNQVGLLDKDNEFWLDHIFSLSDIKHYLDAFEGRIRVVVTSELISNILLALVLFIVLLFLGTNIFVGEKTWGEIVIYLLALRYGFGKLKQVSKQLTSINRFYPQLKRYFTFLESTKKVNHKKNKKLVNYTAQINPKNSNTKLTNKSFMKISQGTKLSLISPLKLNRYSLYLFIKCLLDSSKEAMVSALNSTFFLPSKYDCLSARPLRESLGLPTGYTWQNLYQEMKETGLCSKFKEQLPPDLEQSISLDIWKKIDLDLKLTIALLTALGSDYQWIVIEEEGFRALPDSTQKYLLERLSDRITVFVFNNDLQALGNYNENAVAVINENELIGLGSLDWFRENKKAIEFVVLKPSQKPKQDIFINNFDEEDDDDF